ncbi:MAG TPA: RNase adapter RapZ [Proteobacteria bacterium]|nr:RNase adapter RapZ [Pseudomonadota bacterium]
MNQQAQLSSVIILTGLSGAGKSCALNVLEDLGYFCIDNLPMTFLPKFIELSGTFSPTRRGIALVMDIREREFPKLFPEVFSALQQKDKSLKLIFLEAQDETLIKRFSETRRKHPLAITTSIVQGISEERKLLYPIRALATHIVDSSNRTVHQLKQQIIKIVAPESGPEKLFISLISFGFRNGIPAEADIVMDVRFLPNPYFTPELRDKTGLDREVQEFVVNQEPSQTFFNHFSNLLHFLIPQYQAEGKTYLTIAIGCTGGQHRSVSISCMLKQKLESSGHQLQLVHRDIPLGKGTSGK